MKDTNSLACTKWNSKYHIVFAPKYRGKVFYGEMNAEIGKILEELCSWKQVNIIEAEICPDHIHMLVEIPAKMSISSFVREGRLKGKSSLIIHERHGNLKYNQREQKFSVKRILCRYNRQKHKENRGLYTKLTKVRLT